MTNDPFADRASLAHHAGFSLIEVVVAMSLLLVGLLGMAQVFYLGLNIASTSSPTLVAREKAREAIESVHTARDTHTILWAQIRNATPPAGCPAGTSAVGGGVFLNGDWDTRSPGPDGLVSTADDLGHEVRPGPDGLFGTADDVPMLGFTRRIDICDVNGNPDLRQVVVTIGYDGSNAIGSRRRQYRLTTFISRFS